MTVTPSTITLSDSIYGFRGTATVNFQNLNGYYRVDQSKLPAGITIEGDTYLGGDQIVVTVPETYEGQTITLQDVLIGYDTREPANIFWYGGPNQQNLVVYVFSIIET
jgi:hypothetical protein